MRDDELLSKMSFVTRNHVFGISWICEQAMLKQPCSDRMTNKNLTILRLVSFLVI